MRKILLMSVAILIFPFLASARTPSEITDWYIKDFQMKVEIREDSSILVTEDILADCGNLPGKHGIFRTLPYEIRTDKGINIETPIRLISITDFSGKKLDYSSSKNYSDKTVTWKIGDADKTVSGENGYEIVYEVENAVWKLDESRDEFYWNLSGNFWDIEIDSFKAEISFPDGIGKSDVETNYYAGYVGEKGSENLEANWKNENTLEIVYPEKLSLGEGVTFSAVFPGGIVAPYEPPFWKKYETVLWLIMPALTFFMVFRIWNRYGKDPKNDKTVIPEFEIPDKLSPGEISLIEKNGSFRNEIITASLIDLAVKGGIKIEEIEKGGIFGGKDYRIKVIDRGKIKTAGELEVMIIEKILGGREKKKISELKNKFQSELQLIRKFGPDLIARKGYIVKSGLSLKITFLVVAFLMLLGSFFLAAISPFLFLGLAVSAVVIFFFAFLMPKRTEKGAETAWKIKGFKLYMETAEKYRQEFNEKENIFEKFLPYAIVFGMTKLWIKKMKEIYGEEYFQSYHPIWYAGILSGGFDVDSFTSSMESVSSSIASNVSSGSGSGGGGFSGGGGGGGGGGGW